MRAELASAVQEPQPWLDNFHRRGYGPAFREYAARYGPLFREALRGADPETAAEDLLDTLEAGRRKERFWNRSGRAFAEKQMVVAYFAPLLLEIGETAFLEALRQAWVRRWPKDPFQPASYKKIRSGFRDTFLGIELRRGGEEEDED